MRARSAILAWCLLFGATLAMAAAAWWLLGREADRVESLAVGTLANRTASVADSIDLLMEDIRLGVEDNVRSVGQTFEPQLPLAELVANNPYIIAGFYFRGSDAVTVWYGDRGDLPAPSELYSGQDSATVYPWSLPEVDAISVMRPEPSLPMPAAAAPSDSFAASAPIVEADYAAEALSDMEAIQQEFAGKNTALKEQRAAVRQVSAQNSFEGVSGFLGASSMEAPELALEEEPPPESEPVALGADLDRLQVAEIAVDQVELEEVSARAREVTAPALTRRSWEDAVVDSEDQWLFWGEVNAGEFYLGVWLDRSAVMAELSKAIGLSQQGDLSVQLVDASGSVVAGGSNRYAGSSIRSADLSMAVGSSLPDWRIESFRANQLNAFGRSFRLVGGIFIVGLSSAILLGSAVLIWQARRDAREAERKTTFVANVSHELKTPLTSIRLFADMLHEGRVSDASKQREYLQTMLNETQRLTRLVNNVLDFSRLERGQRKSKRALVDLNSVVGTIIDTQRERLQADGLSLSYSAPDSSLEVEVDADALEQIVLNLLDNAAKYASEGERAEVVLKSEAGGWSLAVKDYGPGIPASERKRVFQAFHRVDERLTSDRPGCGLGLSIAVRLSEEMGGRLILEDNAPHGCIFTLSVANADSSR